MIYALKFNKYKKQSGYDPIINEHIAQLKEEEAKRVKIIKKFYPKEYEEILEESKKEQDTGIVEWTKSPLKNYEKRLYVVRAAKLFFTSLGERGLLPYRARYEAHTGVASALLGDYPQIQQSKADIAVLVFLGVRGHVLYYALDVAKLRLRHRQSKQRAGNVRAFVGRMEIEVLGHESALAREAEKFRIVFVRAYRHMGVFPKADSFYCPRDFVRIIGEHDINRAVLTVFSVHSAHSPL